MMNPAGILNGLTNSGQMSGSSGVSGDDKFDLSAAGQFGSVNYKTDSTFKYLVIGAAVLGALYILKK